MMLELVPLRGAEDVVGLKVLPVVSEVVRALTICVSRIGADRVEVVAGTVLVPLDEATVRLLTCSFSRLEPEVLTLARLPDTLPWAAKSWKVCPAAGWKPP